jgi:hypothetical protein
VPETKPWFGAHLKIKRREGWLVAQKRKHYPVQHQVRHLTLVTAIPKLRDALEDASRCMCVGTLIPGSS